MPMNNTLLSLLQLASPALPVGAYSYSEGLETLVENGIIKDALSLKHWLEQELKYGAIRLEAAVMVRAYHFAQIGDKAALDDWNNWLSAAKETQELRQQSWQMGQSLLRLLSIMPDEMAKPSLELTFSTNNPCNFAIAFGVTAAYWKIDSPSSALLGYLHSWTTNLVTAGIKLIPLGQTAGQQLLLELRTNISYEAETIIALSDDELSSCGWGLALASMAHETQYTRLFQS